MVKTLINTKYSGRSEKEISSGKPANKQFDYKYEASMTDQTFNYSIAAKVEDFIAAGQVIQAAAERKNELPVSSQFQTVEHQIDSFYGEDLPVVQKNIRNEAKRISEILENEDISEKERKAMEIYLSELNKAGGVEGVGA